MKRLAIISLLVGAVVWLAATPPPGASVEFDPQAAKAAAKYLNKIRQNPAKHSQAVGINLRKYERRAPLNWNDQLAKAARWKVRDMAEKDYFNHIDKNGYGMNHHINRFGYALNADWLEDKRANNFESLFAATDPKSAKQVINDLIVDEGYRVPGHRIHLLGVDEWNASLKDIGIAFGTDTSAGRDKDGIRFFVCIIIAKHDW